MTASILGHLDRLADEHPEKLLYSYLDVNGDSLESYTYESFRHQPKRSPGICGRKVVSRPATGCCWLTRRGSK